MRRYRCYRIANRAKLFLSQLQLILTPRMSHHHRYGLLRFIVLCMKIWKNSYSMSTQGVVFALTKICDAEYNDASSKTNTITCNYVLFAISCDINIRYCRKLNFLVTWMVKCWVEIQFWTFLCNRMTYKQRLTLTQHSTHRFSFNQY